ncbi:MAG: AIR synthase-related protein [Candidatus Marinimicrobia bacterium]|nr:AIR synthase-related protein [Candidatus Neomarinimicrobiota bacterium]
MEKFTSHLNKLLGRMPTDLELEVFGPFGPYESNREKRFANFNSSRPLYLNIDNDHFVYISNHTNRLRCCLDMATRHLDTSSCYRHEHGTIMLGVAKPENEKHLRSRHINYHIYIQSATNNSAAKFLASVSNFADHISLIRDETPWERLCRVCVETNTGGHITASSKRLFKTYENGLLYIVADHQHFNFNEAVKKSNSVPMFIGKTVSYPILSLDNEKGFLEIPISTLKKLQQEQLKTGAVKHPSNPDNESYDILKDIDEEPDIINKLFKLVQKEQNAYPAKFYSFSDEIPELRIDAISLNSLSFSLTGIELHTLSGIVNMQIRGLKPLALSYYMESTADSPQEIEPYLNAIKKSAKLFGIPIANNCIVPGKTNRLKLFFISKKESDILPHTFQQENDFICLLGDPNGVLVGSAYAHVHGKTEPYTPPGVMTGTLAALVDVIKECSDKKVISSASMISRGGLITVLKEAGKNGLGASIYSERKGPAQVFIFGEPQAAAMVTIKENHLIDLARITSNFNLTSTTIGRVSSDPEIRINNEVLIEKQS